MESAGPWGFSPADTKQRRPNTATMIPNTNLFTTHLLSFFDLIPNDPIYITLIY